jgi:hypothetical protein
MPGRETRHNCWEARYTCWEVRHNCWEARYTCWEARHTCREARHTCWEVRHTCWEVRHNWSRVSVQPRSLCLVSRPSTPTTWMTSARGGLDRSRRGCDCGTEPEQSREGLRCGEHERKPKDEEILHGFAREIGDRAPVWDLGCGPGQMAAYLRDLGVEISGLDLQSWSRPRTRPSATPSTRGLGAGARDEGLEQERSGGSRVS